MPERLPLHKSEIRWHFLRTPRDGYRSRLQTVFALGEQTRCETQRRPIERGANDEDGYYRIHWKRRLGQLTFRLSWNKG